MAATSCSRVAGSKNSGGLMLVTEEWTAVTSDRNRDSRALLSDLRK